MPLSDSAIAGIVGSIVTAIIGLTGYMVNRKNAASTADDLMKKQQISQLALLRDIRNDGLSEFRHDLEALKGELSTLRGEFRTQGIELLETQRKLAVAEAAFLRSEAEKVILQENIAEMAKDMDELRIRTAAAVSDAENWKQAYQDMYEKYDRQTEQYQITLMNNQNQAAEIRQLRDEMNILRLSMQGGEMGR